MSKTKTNTEILTTLPPLPPASERIECPDPLSDANRSQALESRTNVYEQARRTGLKNAPDSLLSEAELSRRNRKRKLEAENAALDAEEKANDAVKAQIVAKRGELE